MPFNKSTCLALLLLIALASAFWGGSRYPSLNMKALHAGTTDLAPLGFDRVVTPSDEASWVETSFATAINWGYTNKQGMTFGLLFAAAILTLLSLIDRKRFERRWANGILGVVIGAPLGVCVNCAAPIARGMYAGGLRAETTLATLITSPTLNIVIITMLFALFPAYIVWLKLGLTLAFVLVGVPVLTALLFRDRPLATVPSAEAPPSRWTIADYHAEADAQTTWRTAAGWVGRHFAKNLWFIVRTTVPLMLLAGLLGAIAVTVLPWESVAALVPGTGHVRLRYLVALAAFGLFLPVPIAFDAILAAALMAGGLPLPYVMVLLVTLGSFSVYAFAIVGQTLSYRVAWGLGAALLVLAVGAGLLTERTQSWLDRREARDLVARFEADSHRPTIASDITPSGLPWATLRPDVPPAPAWEPVPTAGRHLAVHRRPHAPVNDAGPWTFERAAGDVFGMTLAQPTTALRLLPPYAQFRAIAAGDVHDDGWEDLLVANHHELVLYANLGGRYARQRLPTDATDTGAPTTDAPYYATAALIDMDGDGWLDIYYSTIDHGHFVLPNDRGHFGTAAPVRLPQPDGPAFTAAPAFGDIDRDGDLDLLLGRWSIGPLSDNASLPSSANAWLYQDGDGFRLEPATEIAGETLSTLLSDWTGDGRLDAAVGNDFDPPDAFFTSTPNGLRPASGLLESGTTTMSIATADVDNDLQPELLVTQFSPANHIRRRPMAAMCGEVAGTPFAAECDALRNYLRRLIQAVTQQRPQLCTEMTSAAHRQDCRAYYYLHQQIRHQTFRCETFLPAWPEYFRSCDIARHHRTTTEHTPTADEVPSNRRTNVLLQRQGTAWVNVAEERGVAQSGWSWSSRFADLDHDGWQDLYIVNGHHAHGQGAREANLFFRNKNGRFVEDTDAAGLTLFHESMAYVYTDLDRDGDLDIVTVPQFGPLWVYRNVGTKPGAVSVEIRDGVGNSHGIGTQLTFVPDDTTETAQYREITASGGFLSFDAPRVHVGGDGFRVYVRWSTGERDTLDVPWHSGYTYRLTRQASFR